MIDTYKTTLEHEDFSGMWHAKKVVLGCQGSFLPIRGQRIEILETFDETASGRSIKGRIEDIKVGIEIKPEVYRYTLTVNILELKNNLKQFGQ